MIEVTSIFLLASLRACFPGGKKSLAAENAILRHQLAVLARKNGLKKCPRLHAEDRIVFGFLGGLLSPAQLFRSTVIIKPSTVLKFHRALVNFKYKTLFSNRGKPGLSGPKNEIITLVVDMKLKNPHMGCLQIAQMISKNFSFQIDKNTVYRILKKHLPSSGPNENESWLALFGREKNSLWCLDFFRVESALLQSYWVMVVIDLFSRQIIGFSVERGALDADSACRMFNQVSAGKRPPKYISTDWDPVFRSHLWEVGLRLKDIRHIRTVPHAPWSHPYVESVIGKIRHECTDRILFFQKREIQRRLDQYGEYFNEHRPHSSLAGNTPMCFADKKAPLKASIKNFSWSSYCGGLFFVPSFRG